MERTEVLDMMSSLKLYGMRSAYDETLATAIKRKHEPQRFVGDLLKAEISEKQARSIKYQLTVAKLPLAKDVDDFAFKNTPINEALVRDLAAGGFIAQQRNVVLVGGTGTGKTHLAIAIARSCIRAGLRGRFFTTVDIVNQLEAQARAGGQGRLADYLTRLDFVILDELGYLPFAQAGGQLLRTKSHQLTKFPPNAIHLLPDETLRHRMYPEGPIVYQDIFDALNARAIEKIGNPSYDDTTYRQTPWNDRHIIRFGGNNEADGNGAKVTIPAGYDTVWLRVLGDRWNVIRAYFADGEREQLGSWTGGRRSANSYAPDGTLADGYAASHQWVPIPTRRAGQLALISRPNTDKDFWISGLAFSKNPWGHAAQSALGYHWKVNGGDATGWGDDDWNGDTRATIGAKTKLVLKVPVVPSGRDKLLYLIEHNSNWNGTIHTAITVGGKPIERFMATYDNPFSRHWNSKSYERYIATRIPKDYIPNGARYLDVIIDMSKQDNVINFREIGTHDLDVPWPS